MVQSWVMLRGGNLKRRILLVISLFVIVIGLSELWHPGITASVISGIITGVVRIFGYFGDIIDALHELVRDISGWY